MPNSIEISDEDLPIGMVVGRYKQEIADLQSQLTAAREEAAHQQSNIENMRVEITDLQEERRTLREKVATLEAKLVGKENAFIQTAGHNIQSASASYTKKHCISDGKQYLTNPPQFCCKFCGTYYQSNTKDTPICKANSYEV